VVVPTIGNTAFFFEPVSNFKNRWLAPGG
jgi:hypothetical protein